MTSIALDVLVYTQETTKITGISDREFTKHKNSYPALSVALNCFCVTLGVSTTCYYCFFIDVLLKIVIIINALHCCCCPLQVTKLSQIIITIVIYHMSSKQTSYLPQHTLSFATPPCL